MDEEKWEEAAGRFEYAARAKNTPGLRYYIGHCLENAGLLVEARESFLRAKELLQSQPAADVAQLIPEALERVESLVPRVSLRGAQPGATVLIDGTEVDGSTGELMINPGEHVLEVRASGYEDFETAVALREGQTEIVHVRMAALESAPPAAPQPVSVVGPEDDSESSSEGARRAVFWTGVGVGSAGLVTGVVGTILFTAANRDLDESDGAIDDLSEGGNSACHQPSGELADACSRLSESGKKRSLGGNLMIGGYAAAGVGAATVLIAHFLWPQVSDGTVRVQAQAAPGRGFVSLGGTF